MSNLKKILLSLVSVFVSLVLAELGFRVLVNLAFIDYPNPDLETVIHQYSPNQELVYELKPSFTTEGGLITTNSFGMRDYEYTLTKPEDVTRIAVIGDSVAFGYKKNPSALPLEETFPKVLEAKLNTTYPKQYEVLNFAVTGYNASQEEIVLKTKVLQFEPDVVILAYVANDDSYTDGLGDLAKQMSPYSLGSRLHSKLISYLLYQYERENARDWDNMNQIWSLFEQLEISGKNHGFDVIVLLSLEKEDFDKFDQQHELVKERAKSHEFGVIDLKEVWQDVEPEIRESYYEDKTHYTSIGMQKVADLLFEYFE